jgi:hypothetical protein
LKTIEEDLKKGRRRGWKARTEAQEVVVVVVVVVERRKLFASRRGP